MRCKEGDKVFASDGESVGKVLVANGAYLIVTEGFFFVNDYHIPADLVARCADGVIGLKVTKQQLRAGVAPTAPASSQKQPASSQKQPASSQKQPASSQKQEEHQASADQIKAIEEELKVAQAKITSRVERHKAAVAALADAMTYAHLRWTAAVEVGSRLDGGEGAGGRTSLIDGMFKDLERDLMEDLLRYLGDPSDSPESTGTGASGA